MKKFEIIDGCKYKFENNEKFEGQPYCTLFNEICKDLAFVCDTNCQVFEDSKQLQCLKQENEGLQMAVNEGLEINAELKHELKELQDAYEKLQNTYIACAKTNQKVKLYKQTLKQIAEATENCIDPEHPAFGEILQKVKEVLDENS